MFWLLLACQSTQETTEKVAERERSVEDTSVDDSGAVVQPEEDTPTDIDQEDSEETGQSNEDPREQTPVSTMIVKATHNSYTGHEKGSIVAQLDDGVRSLELDFHDNDYSSLQAYQLGHVQAGSEVSLGSGNPDRTHLQDWLGLIYDWSVANPEHSLITVVLDIKDNLTDNYSYQEGNLAAVNDLIVDQFSTRLLPSTDWNVDFTVAETRGKIQVILSGDAGTRKMYKRDKGHNPAVAVNDLGQVISVHDSGTGNLWYWTGQINALGAVEWKRHGKYDTGTLPAIALNNDCWFVEVHQSENSNTLWSHIGYLNSDYEPVFYPSEQYDNGQAPTIAFLSLQGTQLKEVHNSAFTGANWKWSVSLNTGSASVNWTDNTQTNEVKFEKSLSQNTNYMVEVWTGVDKNAPSDTLLYATNGVSRDRIRYPQVAHVELQKNDSSELEDDETVFSATNSGDFSSIQLWNSRGYLSRMWEFEAGDIREDSVSFPATDEPMASWYQDYMEGIPALE